MTEPLAWCTTGVALIGLVLSLRRPGLGWALAAGIAIAVAASVRYSAAPLLLVPAWAWFAVSRLPRPKLFLDARPLVWCLPVVGSAAAWLRLDPSLEVALQSFLVNVDSGIPRWSVENLEWMGSALSEAYAGSMPLAFGMLLSGLGVGVAATWRAWRGEHGGVADGIGLVAVAAFVGIAGVWFHQYKLERTLYPIYPCLLLGGLSGPAWLWTRLSGRLRMGALCLMTGAVGAWSAVASDRLSEEGALSRLEVGAPSDISRLAVDVVAAASGETVAIAGFHHMLSIPSLRLQLRMARPGVDLRVDMPPPPWCRDDVSGNSECQPGQVLELLAEQPEDFDWSVVTVETLSPTRGRSGGRRRGTRGEPVSGPTWSSQQASLVDSVAEAEGVPLVLDQDVVEGHLRVRVYGYRHAPRDE